MNTKNLALIGFVAVLLIGGFFLLSNKANNKTQTNVTASSSPTTSPVTSPSEKVEKKITVTKNGFEPKELKIKVGTTVVWENKTGETVNVSSDPHPTHNLFPFLNLGSFDGTISVAFEKVGVYTYHNHLNALQTGTVIVE